MTSQSISRASVRDLLLRHSIDHHDDRRFVRGEPDELQRRHCLLSGRHVGRAHAERAVRVELERDADRYLATRGGTEAAELHFAEVGVLHELRVLPLRYAYAYHGLVVTARRELSRPLTGYFGISRDDRVAIPA